MPKDNTRYYYAVGKGRQTGVFDTWAECNKHITGLTNARYKKFKTYEEAEAFVQQFQNNSSPKKFITPVKEQPSPTATYYVSKSSGAEKQNTILYENSNFLLGVKVKQEFENKEEVFIPIVSNGDSKVIPERTKLKDSQYYNFKSYYVKNERPAIEPGHSHQELENILKLRKNLNEENVNNITKELFNKSDPALKKAFQMIFDLIGININSQSEAQPSTSTGEVFTVEPSNKPVNANQIDLADIKAVNLRLDSFEKRFDDCLKQMGAITAELENLKGQVKNIQDSFQEFKTKDRNNGTRDDEGRSYKHRSASIQNAFQEAVEPVRLSSNSRRDDNEASTSRSQKHLKRKRSPSRRTREGSSQSEDSQPSISNFPVPIKKEKEVKQEKMDLQTFTVGDDEYVHVYTDGCCHYNGTPRARAGIGIWFGENHSMNVSAPLDGDIPTNNNAEIQAARMAIELAAKAGIQKLRIFTDSGFMISCATEWMKKWKVNGWKTNDNKDVKNEIELKKLDEAMKLLTVKWEKVAAHRGILGNEMADKLANQGALRYRPKL